MQPGPGYRFTSSSMGITLDIGDPWPDKTQSLFQQFECVVVAEAKTGGGFDYYLKTRKGVVNYTWSQFPFYPSDDGAGAGFGFRSFEKQARITDWAVYQNGTRTAGTATDGPDFEWMAGNGKIKLPTGTAGASMLVTISKIDWWDRDSWLSAYRTIDAERPFVSVFPTSDTNIATAMLMQQGCSVWNPNMIHWDGYNVTFTGPYPRNIGYTFKKIAQLDWNDTTNQWDVTQYEIGPINLPIHHFVQTVLDSTNATSPTQYEVALDNEFDSCLNYAWFEGMWAYPGYTMNPSNWWYDLVNT